MTNFPYRADQELPAIPVAWYDGDNTLIDFSTGWTFTVKLALQETPTTVVLSKTTGITGAATSPNVTIDWSTSDFTGLTAAAGGTTYVWHLVARRTSDSKDRVFRPGRPDTLTLFAAPA